MSESSHPPTDDWTGHDLHNDPHAVWVRKRPVSVEAEFASEAGVLQTLEGPVHYVAGDALLTGSVGERWPVARQRFNQTYEPVGSGLTARVGMYQKLPQRVRARRMESEFTVRVGCALDLLRGSTGDWLLQYGLEERGVVSAARFAETYVICGGEVRE